MVERSLSNLLVQATLQTTSWRDEDLHEVPQVRQKSEKTYHIGPHLLPQTMH